MKVLYPITLDVKQTNVQKIIPVNQGEGADRELCFTLVAGDETLNLTAENTVSIKGKKPDGTVFFNDCIIKDGKVYYYLTTQNLAVVGEVDCQLSIVSDGLTYSAKFVLDVEEPIVLDTTIQSANEFSQLVTLIQTVGKGKVYSGTTNPSTDPDNYALIKAEDWYLKKDSTNHKLSFYKANSVSTVITWDTPFVVPTTDYYSAGNGISLNNGVIAVKVNDGSIDFDSNGKLQVIFDSEFNDGILKDNEGIYVDIETLAYNSSVRDKLCDSDGQGTPLVNEYGLDTALSGKQDTLTAGDGIEIDDNDEIAVQLYSSPYNALSFHTVSLGKKALQLDYAALGQTELFRGALSDTRFTLPLATKAYVDDKLSGKLKKQIVSELPTTDIDLDTIYMILRTVPTTNNIYDEYMYTLKSTNPDVYDWELIGNTEVDLSNYYTKTQSDNRYNAKLTDGNGIDITSDTISININGSFLTFANKGLTINTTVLGSSYSLRQKLADGDSTTYALASKADLANKQDTIDSTHKLSTDNVDDSESTNKFVSATEKAAIGKEPKYELIKTIDISELSEPVSQIIINQDEQGNSFAYDDFLIDTIGVKTGADNCKYLQTLYVSSSNQLKFNKTNMLGTTAKSVTAEFNRRSIDKWSYNMLGDYKEYGGGNLNRSAYTDKIGKVIITTDSVGFTDGVIKLYGKVKY